MTEPTLPPPGRARRRAAGSGPAEFEPVQHRASPICSTRVLVSGRGSASAMLGAAALDLALRIDAPVRELELGVRRRG